MDSLMPLLLAIAILLSWFGVYRLGFQDGKDEERSEESFRRIDALLERCRKAAEENKRP